MPGGDHINKTEEPGGSLPHNVGINSTINAITFGKKLGKGTLLSKTISIQAGTLCTK